MSVNDFSRTDEGFAEIDLDAEAATALRSWQFLVRALPHLVDGKERRRALLALMYWYGRVCRDDEFADSPPIEGLDALIDELASVSVPYNVHAELARARWAVRLAEELVSWRQVLDDSGSGSEPLARATEQLEAILSEAHRHIVARPVAAEAPVWPTRLDPLSRDTVAVIPEADRREQDLPPEVDLRLGRAHDADRPEADVLEQELPVGHVAEAEAEPVVDADRIEPVDDSEWLIDEVDP